MSKATIHSANTSLSKLIESAMNGEDVIITKGAEPMVRQVPVVQGWFKVGILKDKLGQSPDFLEPMDANDLDRWDGGA